MSSWLHTLVVWCALLCSPSYQLFIPWNDAVAYCRTHSSSKDDNLSPGRKFWQITEDAVSSSDSSWATFCEGVSETTLGTPHFHILPCATPLQVRCITTHEMRHSPKVRAQAVSINEGTYGAAQDNNKQIYYLFSSVGTQDVLMLYDSCFYIGLVDSSGAVKFNPAVSPTNVCSQLPDLQSETTTVTMVGQNSLAVSASWYASSQIPQVSPILKWSSSQNPTVYGIDCATVYPPRSLIPGVSVKLPKHNTETDLLHKGIAFPVFFESKPASNLILALQATPEGIGAIAEGYLWSRTEFLQLGVATLIAEASALSATLTVPSAGWYIIVLTTATSSPHDAVISRWSLSSSPPPPLAVLPAPTTPCLRNGVPNTGWFYSAPYGRYQHRITTSTDTTYDGIKDKCLTDGGSLAVMRSKEDFDVVFSKLTEAGTPMNGMISLYNNKTITDLNAATKDDWRWPDGTTLAANIGTDLEHGSVPKRCAAVTAEQPQKIQSVQCDAIDDSPFRVVCEKTRGPRSWQKNPDTNTEFLVVGIENYSHNHNEAITACKDYGAELATFNTDDEWNFITTNLNPEDKVWVGMMKQLPSSSQDYQQWVSDDGKPAPKSYWASDEPYNTQACVLLGGYPNTITPTGTVEIGLRTMSCDEKFAALCMKTQSPCEYKHQYNSKQYCVSKDVTHGFSEAQALCVQTGGTLVVIEDRLEYEYITAVIDVTGTTAPYVSVKSDASTVTPSTFKWVPDGTTVAANLWDNGEPGADSCTKTHKGGLHDTKCDDDRLALCQKPFNGTPGGSPTCTFTNPFGTKTYCVSPTQIEFGEALYFCSVNNAHLAYIQSLDEATHVRKLADGLGEQVWLGLYNDLVEDDMAPDNKPDWKWLFDHTIPLEVLWQPDKPDAPKRCGVMEKKGLDIENCDSPSYALCVRDTATTPTCPVPNPEYLIPSSAPSGFAVGQLYSPSNSQYTYNITEGNSDDQFRITPTSEIQLTKAATVLTARKLLITITSQFNVSTTCQARIGFDQPATPPSQQLPPAQPPVAAGCTAPTLENGQWTSNGGSCVNILPGDAACTLVCDAGYRPDGIGDARCESFLGVWSKGINLKCEGIPPSAVPSAPPPSGSVGCTDCGACRQCDKITGKCGNADGENCKTGHEDINGLCINGICTKVDITISCNRPAHRWHALLQPMSSNNETLGTGEFIPYESLNETYIMGTTLAYACNPPYILAADYSTITCDHTRHWVPEPAPFCIGKVSSSLNNRAQDSTRAASSVLVKGSSVLSSNVAMASGLGNAVPLLIQRCTQGLGREKQHTMDVVLRPLFFIKVDNDDVNLAVTTTAMLTALLLILLIVSVVLAKIWKRAVVDMFCVIRAPNILYVAILFAYQGLSLSGFDLILGRIQPSLIGHKALGGVICIITLCWPILLMFPIIPKIKRSCVHHSFQCTPLYNMQMNPLYLPSYPLAVLVPDWYWYSPSNPALIMGCSLYISGAQPVRKSFLSEPLQIVTIWLTSCLVSAIHHHCKGLAWALLVMGAVRAIMILAWRPTRSLFQGCMLACLQLTVLGQIIFGVLYIVESVTVVFGVLALVGAICYIVHVLYDIFIEIRTISKLKRFDQAWEDGTLDNDALLSNPEDHDYYNSNVHPDNDMADYITDEGEQQGSVEGASSYDQQPDWGYN